MVSVNQQLILRNFILLDEVLMSKLTRNLLKSSKISSGARQEKHWATTSIV